MPTIRIAEVQDAAAIAHVHVQSWLTTYAGILPDQYLASLNEAERIPIWQDWLRRDIRVFVAEVEGSVVGFAGGGGIREPLDGYDAELYTIYLLKDAQSRGIGKALLAAVARTLILEGHKNMLVWVLEQNPAVHFYEKTGAHYLTRKPIEIGGIQLSEFAFGWTDLHALANFPSEPSF